MGQLRYYGSIMRICIATGIYPPATSGPAQYAAAMEAEFKARGFEVQVVTYDLEHKLPTGVRHLWYFLRVLPVIARSDITLALDTFSVGFPATIAARLFRKKIIIRTGGDFLFEQFVERTNEPVLLSRFYLDTVNRLSIKERIIFAITQWTLRAVDTVVFSTEWQRDIFMKPYQLEHKKTCVVDNRFDEKISDEQAPVKNFIFATRNIAFKNIERCKEAFLIVQKKHPEISLEIYHTVPHDELIKKMKSCYAVIMPSLGEISPHVIIDAIRCNRPFILTRESGYAARFSDIGVLVDPCSVQDIARGVESLVDDATYKVMHDRVKSFSYTHSWKEVADELLDVIKSI